MGKIHLVEVQGSGMDEACTPRYHYYYHNYSYYYFFIGIIIFMMQQPTTQLPAIQYWVTTLPM